MTSAQTLAERLARGIVYDVQSLASMLHGLPLEAYCQLTDGAMLLTFRDGSEAYVNAEANLVRVRNTS